MKPTETYLFKNGQQMGPYSCGVLRAYWDQGQIGEGDLIWDAKADAWVPGAQFFAPPPPLPERSKYFASRFLAGLILFAIIFLAVKQAWPHLSMENSWIFCRAAGALAVLFIVAFIYFLPTWVAKKRNHRNAQAVLVVNLFLGWTLIGWVAAFAWALLAQEAQVAKVEAARS